MDEDFEMADEKRGQSGSEDGEISDSDSNDTHSRKHASEKKVYKAEANNTIHSIFGDGDLAKMEERAQRFGLNKASDTIQLDTELKELYKSLSITDEQVIRHTRFDSIYLHGTEKMNTNDVFEYFFTHKPIFLEWINENSCNIVWKDDMSAARAMVFYSKMIKEGNDSTMSGGQDDENDIDMEDPESSDKWGGAINVADIPARLPPGKWRFGAPHPKAEYLFLRFANKSDIQASGTEKLKVYSKKYNDPNHDRVKSGIISESMKSKIMANEIDEEKTKNPWGELCETWGIYDSQEVFGVETIDASSQRLRNPRNKNSDTGGPNSISHDRVPISERLMMPKRENEQNGVRLRLGKRQNPKSIPIIDESNSDEEENSSDEDWTKRNKLPRMRMHADDEQEKINKVRDRIKIPQRAYDDEDINNITVQVKNERPAISDPPSIKERLGNEFSNGRSNTTNSKPDLRSRLGVRRDSFDSESDDDDSTGKRQGRSSVINKVKSSVRQKPSVQSTVWSRLDKSENSREDQSYSGSDYEEEIADDFKANMSKPKIEPSARPGFEKVDLRSRLGKKTHQQRSPLRIEVDNELCVESEED